MSVVGYQAEQQRIYNGPVPWPTPPGWFPPGTKRPLENPEAYHAPIPHPSQRQRPPDSYWPVNDPNPQNAAPQPGMPFYAVGQQQQQQQTRHDFSLGAVGQAAPPPLEAELMGLADPATLAKKRSEMVAKLDKLSPDTIKALLLEASLRNFTVADQVNLEHDKITNLVPGATVPAPVNGAIAARLNHIHPPPQPAPVAPQPPVQREPPVSFDHYNDASWRELTRYDRYSCSKQFDLAFNVQDALERMFANISRSVSKNDHFLTKSSALHAMLAIWDNSFGCTGSEVGKQVRNECHAWVSHLQLVLNKLDADDARKLRDGPVQNGSIDSWVKCARKTRDEAGSYCSPVKEALMEAIDTVNSKAMGEGEDEEEDENEYDDEEYDEERQYEEEGEEDYEEEDDEEDYEEEEVREYEPAIVAQPNSHPRVDGGTRSQPVILD
ncbi:hypothetical protein F5X68DRAFT_230433 [Plectosphaerella plurivora]|uniref:Uncharacterized protein n=1 Tax=Plectosphaerella plurivora TaxID=936078 RepID=A0A9P8VGE2_9PEZI|nr:hypothetical protein F5X68DRAFT_230433 [Plectosphaerella plurivora]